MNKLKFESKPEEWLAYGSWRCRYLWIGRRCGVKNERLNLYGLLALHSSIDSTTYQ